MAGVPTRSGALRTLEFRDTPNMASIQRPENVTHRSDDASPKYRTMTIGRVAHPALGDR